MTRPSSDFEMSKSFIREASAVTLGPKVMSASDWEFSRSLAKETSFRLLDTSSSLALDGWSTAEQLFSLAGGESSIFSSSCKFNCLLLNFVGGYAQQGDINPLYSNATSKHDTTAKLSPRHPFTTVVQWHLLILAFLGLKGLFVLFTLCSSAFYN